MAERQITVSGDLTIDAKFKEAMEEIRERGFIESHRKGDTGIGKTLEDELGVEENSVQAADLDKVELKSNRRNSNSKITLFTKSPDKRDVNNKALRVKYRYHTEESRELNPNINILHTTVNGKGFNSLDGESFIKLTERDNKIYLEHATDGVLEDACWSKDNFKKAFDKKYPAKKMYHVQADSKVEDENESFHYTEAYSLENFSSDDMMASLMSGDLEIDIRLGSVCVCQ